MTFPDTALILTLLATGLVAWGVGLLLGLWLLGLGVVRLVCRAYPATGRRRAPLPGTAAEDEAALAAHDEALNSATTPTNPEA